MNTIDLIVPQGDTFEATFLWESEETIFRAISVISQTAPVQITATGHGLVDGWRAVVQGVKGMHEINPRFFPPTAADYRFVTVLDANTVVFSDVDASTFSAYVSGGYIRYSAPVDLTGYTARMNICASIGAPVLLRLTDTNLMIVIDDVTKTVKLNISAVDTAALPSGASVYSLEMVSATGVVSTIAEGNFTVVPEPTTS